MNQTFQVGLAGVQDGYDVAQVAQSLAKLFKRTPEQMLAALKKPQIVKKGLDHAAAQKYRVLLERHGCRCNVQTELALQPVPTASSDPANRSAEPDISSLDLQTVLWKDYSIVFYAPRSWQESSNEQGVQMTDPATGTHFSLHAVQSDGSSLAQWSALLLGAVKQQMPYCRPYKAAYPMQGVGWSGMAAEFRGVVPGQSHESHYVVVALIHSGAMLSLSVGATVASFERNQALYRWLLREQFQAATIRRVSPGEMAQIMAKQGPAQAPASSSAESVPEVTHEVGHISANRPFQVRVPHTMCCNCGTRSQVQGVDTLFLKRIPFAGPGDRVPGFNLNLPYCPSCAHEVGKTKMSLPAQIALGAVMWLVAAGLMAMWLGDEGRSPNILKTIIVMGLPLIGVAGWIWITNTPAAPKTSVCTPVRIPEYSLPLDTLTKPNYSTVPGMLFSWAISVVGFVVRAAMGSDPHRIQRLTFKFSNRRYAEDFRKANLPMVKTGFIRIR